MHYRCRSEFCAEIFALERVRDTDSGRTSASFCPFCGAVGSLVQVSAHSASLIGPREKRGWGTLVAELSDGREYGG